MAKIARKRLTRKMVAATRVSLDGKPRTCHSLFLDSGAHSLYTEYARGLSKSEKYAFFEKPKSEWLKQPGGRLTREFRRYVDGYAAFIRKFWKGIDWYVNVDVIYDPRLSWHVLKYLEREHGLNPIPVIHSRTPLEWVHKHLEAGYKFLGIGGLGQETTKESYTGWADQVFNIICANPDRLPCVRTHGFAMTAYELIIRYPWWSVDSASWAKAAGFGSIYVPHKRRGQFTFAEDPYVVGFSHRSEARKIKGKHYKTLTPGEKKIVQEWVEKIGLKIGSVRHGEMKEYGVYSSYNARAVANLRFFQELCAWLPKWPWAFKKQPNRGFFTPDQLR